MSRLVLALFADTHAGSNKALCPANIVLYKDDLDGNLVPWTPALTPEQVQLANLYEWHMAQVIEFAHGDPVGVLHVGDVTQGSAFKEDLMDADVANQVLIAIGNMNRWFRWPNVMYMRLASGTGVHEFGDHAATKLVTQALALGHPDKDIRLVHHGLIDLGGISIDYSHHGPGKGKRVWQEMNDAAWYLKSFMTGELFDGGFPAGLVVRADQHGFGKASWTFSTKRGLVESTLIVLPSYQAPGAFVRKVTRSDYRVHFGMVAVEVVDGELGRIRPLIKMYDLRTKESWG